MSCDNLKQYSVEEMKRLASQLIGKKYSQNYTLQAQNKPVTNFNILVSGIVSVQKVFQKAKIKKEMLDPLNHALFDQLPDTFSVEVF